VLIKGALRPSAGCHANAMFVFGLLARSVPESLSALSLALQANGAHIIEYSVCVCVESAPWMVALTRYCGWPSSVLGNNV
jgi:hypothetical protein